jgi:hypothetical protein
MAHYKSALPLTGKASGGETLRLTASRRQSQWGDEEVTTLDDLSIRAFKEFTESEDLGIGDRYPTVKQLEEIARITDELIANLGESFNSIMSTVSNSIHTCVNVVREIMEEDDDSI